MGYNKLKSEKYTNLGGINQKSSQYVLGDNEFLDLLNVDFQIPGALSQRWGFTAAYIPSSSFAIGGSQTINAIWQVNGLGVGFTTSLGVTVSYPLFKNLNLFGYDFGVAATSATIQGATLIPWVTSATLGNGYPRNWDHSEFLEATYYCGGIRNGGLDIFNQAFKNAPGDTRAYYWGMITPPSPTSGLTVTATTAGTSFSGTYVYQYGYLDRLGFVGQLGGTFVYSTAGANTITISGFTTQTALDYGLTAFVVFRNRVEGFPSTEMVSVGSIAYTTLSYTDSFPQNVNVYQQYPNPTSSGPTSYSPVNLGTGTLSSIDPGFNRWDVSEIYQNRFWINYQTFNIAFSELENPQHIVPENIRIFSNKNFPVTSLRNYNQSLMVMCQKGIFRLTGDNPDNFTISEMSTEYGCLSDKSVVVFEEKMWFLDYQNIVEFNGSNLSDVGNRVDEYLKRINNDAAYQKACSMHLPERNEVWFSVPIDGSTVNNITLVYDYLANGWTTFKGTKLKATALAQLYFKQSTTGLSDLNAPSLKYYYFGSIGASMYKFGTEFENDDGDGITLSYTTKYHNELGKSQTAQFRRYYLDLGSYTGPTLTFGNEFFANYVTAAPYYTVAMNFNIWQDRIDFGIPAKALSIRTSIGVTTGRLTMYGYTIEFRFQRAV